MTSPTIYNPQLEGDPFLWEGGPTGVLLVHGYTATTAEVRPLARTLHCQGYTVAGPVLPGHFTQPEDANRYGWRDWVRAVEESYRQLSARCQRVIIGGESLGGLLSLYLASEHPEVAAILAYAPALKLKMGPRAPAPAAPGARPFVAQQPPILIVQGRLDATVDPSAAETIYSEVRSPVKELHWMPNSQHCVIIDRERERVNQLTLDFLRRVGA